MKCQDSTDKPVQLLNLCSAARDWSLSLTTIPTEQDSYPSAPSGVTAGAAAGAGAAAAAGAGAAAVAAAGAAAAAAGA